MAQQATTYRINRLAKDLNIKSKDILDMLTEAGLDGKTHMAILEPAEFNLFMQLATSKSQISNLDEYVKGEAVIPRKAPKKAKVEKDKADSADAVKEQSAAPQTQPEKKAQEKAPEKSQTKGQDNNAQTQSKSGAQTSSASAAATTTTTTTSTPAASTTTTTTTSTTSTSSTTSTPSRGTPVLTGRGTPVLPGKKSQQGGKQSQSQQQQSKQKQGQQQSKGGKPASAQGQQKQQSQQQNGQGQQKRQEKQEKVVAMGRGQVEAPKKNRGPWTPAEGAVSAPKKKEAQGEARQRTGNTRVVDTRAGSVDLSKYDEKLQSYVSDRDDNIVTKQKLKKQNNKSVSGKDRDKERRAMEKLRKEEVERQRRQQLTIQIPDEITVGELANRLKITSSEVIKKLMQSGVMATVNQTIDFDTAYIITEELGAKAEREVVVTIEDQLFSAADDKDEDLIERSPVVCVMGHVDHGKTSLLDKIRHTHVTAGEAGGITQHIGAYRVEINGKNITFLDTPGHEAFTAMRLRGAMATDIAVIVVAADDGIMPQTIVAINKMDKPSAHPDGVMQELTKYDLVPEEWGGDVMCVPVSAVTGQGIDTLLEDILLIAEMQEYKANPNRRASGLVIEAKLDRGRGPVATVLVQNGTLRSGDIVIAGTSVGRVRAMTDENGKKLKTAGPSVPVEITGLAEVPAAGDEFRAVEDERMARELADQRRAKEKEEEFRANARANLSDMFAQIESGVKDFNIIVKADGGTGWFAKLSVSVKADVKGSAEAVKSSLQKISNDEVRIQIIHSAVGGIIESDVQLAAASNAVIVGFNVRPDKAALDMAERMGVDIRTYRVIYECIDEITAAMKGMLAPQYREELLGHAEVRQTIHVPNVGTIAGSYVLDGKIARNAQIRIVRDGVVIFEDKISSLRHFKEDRREMAQGYECGIGLERYGDIKEGDILECFQMVEIER